MAEAEAEAGAEEQEEEEAAEAEAEGGGGGRPHGGDEAAARSREAPERRAARGALAPAGEAEASFASSGSGLAEDTPAAGAAVTWIRPAC